MQELVTRNGEKHGLINTVGNSCPDTGFKHMNASDKPKAEKLRKEESRIVKAKYINYRSNNERLPMPYMRWEGDPIQMWNFIPGEIYDVPLGLVNQVNGNPGLPVRSEIVDSKGVPTVKDSKPMKIHEFFIIN